jgi:hypothetical protein
MSDLSSNGGKASCRRSLARLILAAGAVSASMTPGEALAARADTRTMTCQQAQDFVRRSGAVVMTTGQHTYDRIVSNRGYCEPDEITWLKIAPTKDNPKCRVGYYCRTRIDDGPLWRIR